jgi:hypothetical protein
VEIVLHCWEVLAKIRRWILGQRLGRTGFDLMKESWILSEKGDPCFELGEDIYILSNAVR